MSYDPANMFVCPRHAGNLRITPESCATLWKRGRRAERCDSLFLCRGCEIGAANAGFSMEAAQAAMAGDQIATARDCLQCGQTRGRLIFNSLCVGCYNRDLEWLRGVNGKHKFPVHAMPLRRFMISVLAPEPKGLSAWTGTFGQFLGVVFRNLPDAKIRWPSITTPAFSTLSRTHCANLPRPFQLEELPI